MDKKILLLFSLSFFCFSCVSNKTKSSFLVDKTPKVSKNGLKEDIGDELKEALFACASLTKKLGKVQQQVARFQKDLLQKVEKLIDNRPPFKKATRKKLNNTLKTMQAITAELAAQKRQVAVMASRMNNSIEGKA